MWHDKNTHLIAVVITVMIIITVITKTTSKSGITIYFLSTWFILH